MTFDKKTVIKELRLEEFGKFKNYIIKLDDLFNVIYGENESGKSTIQLFIRFMLYGLKTTKRKDTPLKDRQAAIPWNAKYATGVMLVEKDGRLLEIRRRAGKTAANDKFELCDAISGERLSEYTSDNVGEKLFGISEDTFEKTLWVRQKNVFMGGKDEDISRRLMNLKESGDEEVSADAAIKRLNEMQRRLKAPSGNYSKGRIDIIEEKITELRDKKYKLSEKLVRNEAARKDIERYKKEFKELSEKIEEANKNYESSLAYERHETKRRKLKEIEACEKEIREIEADKLFEYSATLNDETVKKAENLKREIDGFDEKEDKHENADGLKACTAKQMRAVIISGVSIVIALAAATGAMIFMLNGKGLFGVITSFVSLLGMAGAVLGVKLIISAKNDMVIITESLKNSENEFKSRVKELEGTKAKLEKILDNYGVKDVDELRCIYVKTAGLMERYRVQTSRRKTYPVGDEYEELKVKCGEEMIEPEWTVDEAKNQLDMLRERSVAVKTELNKNETKMAYEVGDVESPADYDTEIATLQEELKECEKRLDAVKLAKAGIESAAQSYRLSVTPKLNKKLDGYMSSLTDGKYDDMRVSEEYGVRIVNGGEIYDAEYLSCGAYEQVYLALRLSISELVCENGVMFLDDVFTVYDDKRMRSAVSVLRKKSLNNQIVLFTCHSSVRECARENNANIICI